MIIFIEVKTNKKVKKDHKKDIKDPQIIIKKRDQKEDNYISTRTVKIKNTNIIVKSVCINRI